MAGFLVHLNPPRRVSHKPSKFTSLFIITRSKLRLSRPGHTDHVGFLKRFLIKYNYNFFNRFVHSANK